jgi:hypothetical protein
MSALDATSARTFADFFDLAPACTLASADHRPHVELVTPTENLRAASNEHTIAIARWEDDGGAPRNAPSDVEAARDERSRPHANQPDSHTRRDR